MASCLPSVVRAVLQTIYFRRSNFKIHQICHVSKKSIWISIFSLRETLPKEKALVGFLTNISFNDCVVHLSNNLFPFFLGMTRCKLTKWRQSLSSRTRAQVKLSEGFSQNIWSRINQRFKLCQGGVCFLVASAAILGMREICSVTVSGK